MKIERLIHAPGTWRDFFEEALTSLARCASARGTTAWKSWPKATAPAVESGRHASRNRTVVSGARNHHGAREAGKQVFPGCPLTFAWRKALRPAPLALEASRVGGRHGRPPARNRRGGKLWRAAVTRNQSLATRIAVRPGAALLAARPDALRNPGHRTSIGSLRRVAVSVPKRRAGYSLAHPSTLRKFADNTDAFPGRSDPSAGGNSSRCAEKALAPTSPRCAIARRKHCGANWTCVDDYFRSITKWKLAARARAAGVKLRSLKAAERLAAAKAEHARRRSDQVARHEIRVHAHLDALL